jgi:hypothetical protein
MNEKILKTIGIATVRAAKAARAEWRQRCTKAMSRFTSETMRQIRQHAVEIDLEGDKGGK